VGFENLRSLTHLAFACCGPEELAIVMPKLPALQYVAFCIYRWIEDVPSVQRKISGGDIKVVWIDGLTLGDWERGATGRGDFWDLVEQEVARRRAVMVCGPVSLTIKLSSTSAGHLKSYYVVCDACVIVLVPTW
jgi:hypothetical protein